MIECLLYRRFSSYSIVIFCFLSSKTFVKALEGTLMSFKNCSKRLRSEGVMDLQTLGGGGEKGHKLEIKNAQGGPRMVNKCCEL
jgi:hypothetical protein